MDFALLLNKIIQENSLIDEHGIFVLIWYMLGISTDLNWLNSINQYSLMSLLFFPKIWRFLDDFDRLDWIELELQIYENQYNQLKDFPLPTNPV